MFEEKAGPQTRCFIQVKRSSVYGREDFGLCNVSCSTFTHTKSGIRNLNLQITGRATANRVCSICSADVLRKCIVILGC